MNLRTPFLAKVSCSDASLSGGGVCVSRGLSEAGHVASSGFELERPCLPGAEGIILISLFDGIGGARRALDVLGMAVCCYICSEIDPEAMRVVTAAWPEAEHWGNVSDITEDWIRRLSLRFPRAVLVLVIGGSPCQQLTGLNADRSGLAGKKTQLFHHVGRIFNLFKKIFCFATVHRLLENVASTGA
jgi:site-specific DNA-cytosine methylase